MSHHDLARRHHRRRPRRPGRRRARAVPRPHAAGARGRAAVGAGIRRWGHVRMFSPWRFNVDAAAAADLLARHGWVLPDGDAFPTGRELVERYLEPLAATPEIAPHLRLDTRVAAVSRQRPRPDEGRRPRRRAVPRAGVRRRTASTTCSRGPSSTPRAPSTRRARSAPPVCRRSASAPRPTASSTASRMCSAPCAPATRAGACSSSAAATPRLNALLDLARARRGRRRHEDHLGDSPADARVSCSAAPGATSSKSAASSARECAACSTRGASSSSPASCSIASTTNGRRHRRERRSAHAAPGRRDHRGHRLPTRLVDPVRAPAGPRPGRREPARAGAAHRSEPPQLRHRAAARRRGAEAPGRRRLRHRHEELRPRADVPDADRLRAGALGRRGHRRRLGGRAPRGAGAAGDRRVLARCLDGGAAGCCGSAESAGGGHARQAPSGRDGHPRGLLLTPAHGPP